MNRDFEMIPHLCKSPRPRACLCDCCLYRCCDTTVIATGAPRGHRTGDAPPPGSIPHSQHVCRQQCQVRLRVCGCVLSWMTCACVVPPCATWCLIVRCSPSPSSSRHLLLPVACPAPSATPPPPAATASPYFPPADTVTAAGSAAASVAGSGPCVSAPAPRPRTSLLTTLLRPPPPASRVPPPPAPRTTACTLTREQMAQCKVGVHDSASSVCRCAVAVPLRAGGGPVGLQVHHCGVGRPPACLCGPTRR